jgi:uncharacterized protein YrrD
MKRNTKDIVGATINAIDGDIGKISKFYFDDASWVIRYFVVETGNWLSQRKVLLSPDAALQPAENIDAIPVNVTKEQVKNSPDIDTDKPVSRQHEKALYQHYTWNAYWGTGFAVPILAAPLPVPPQADTQEEDKREDDPHLRSTKKIKGYSIKATDDTVGDVDDFIIDDRTWRIHHLVIDTGQWLVGKKILLPVDLVQQIDWSSSTIEVNVSAEQLRGCPEYDSDEPITEAQETQLSEYYKVTG